MLICYLSMIEDQDDKDAFEQLYINYSKQMFYLAKSLLHEDATAEDAVHDVFVAVASKHMATVRKIEHAADLRNYLLKATKNCCLNYIHKRERTPVSLNEVCEINPDGFGNGVTDEDFWERVHNVTEAKRVVDAIAALPDTYRDVLYYHFVMELTSKEIAALTGNKLPTVKKKLVRGKAALLQSLNMQEVKNKL